MSREVQNSLQDLHEELGKIDEQDTHNLRERIASFIHQLGDEGEELGDDLLEQLLQAEATFETQYPDVVATLRRAINIMSNAGI